MFDMMDEKIIAILAYLDLWNSPDLDQIPQNEPSDQGLKCLLTEYSICYNLNKIEQYHPTTLKLEMNLSNW